MFHDQNHKFEAQHSLEKQNTLPAQLPETSIYNPAQYESALKILQDGNPKINLEDLGFPALTTGDVQNGETKPYHDGKTEELPSDKDGNFLIKDKFGHVTEKLDSNLKVLEKYTYDKEGNLDSYTGSDGHLRKKLAPLDAVTGTNLWIDSTSSPPTFAAIPGETFDNDGRPIIPGINDNTLGDKSARSKTRDASKSLDEAPPTNNLTWEDIVKWLNYLAKYLHNL